MSALMNVIVTIEKYSLNKQRCVILCHLKHDDGDLMDLPTNLDSRSLRWSRDDHQCSEYLFI